MKKTNRYYISTEGEIEKYYFQHLEKLINNCESSMYKAKFVIKVDKSITSNCRRISSPYKETAFHICDYESNAPEHTKVFLGVLDELREVEKNNPNLNYSLGYSNFAIELWIVIHKNQCLSPKTNRFQYLTDINNAYLTHFNSLDEYKKEENFKNRILSQISLEDIGQAIKNAKMIRKANDDDDGKKIMTYKSFKYYRENPDLTIFECVEKILKDCKIVL